MYMYIHTLNAKLKDACMLLAKLNTDEGLARSHPSLLNLLQLTLLELGGSAG